MTREEIKKTVEGEYIYNSNNPSERVKQVKFLLSECERLELELRKSTSELSKWLAPHEDSELQDMKKQSHQSSLAVKQAYINALEWTIKHREARVKELERQLEVSLSIQHIEKEILIKEIERQKHLEEGIKEIWKLLDTMDDFPTLIEVRQICNKLMEEKP